MISDIKNMVLMILTLALFTGATIEISEGSTYIGIILFCISLLIIMKINLKGQTFTENSKKYVLLGFFILAADIIYNASRNGSLGTLDLMTFFFGISFVALGVKKSQIRRMGEFGAYISGIFIVLYLIFYSLFGSLNILFIHKFDHYFVLLPTVFIMNLIGVPLEVVGTETVRLSGIQDMTIVIGGPCSGLYSMFLLIGMVFGYVRIEKLNSKKTLMYLGFSIAVAYISNLIRVLILYLTAYEFGPEAMMIVHTHLGWIIFAVSATLIIYLVERKL